MSIAPLHIPLLYSVMMATAQPVRPAGQDIRRGLILLVLLLPLFYFPNLINLYRLPKETLMAFLTAVVSGLYLLNRIRPGHNERVALPLAVPLYLYLVISGLSLINAINFYEGIRHFLSLTIGLTLFWITANSTNRDWIRSFFYWILLAGAAASLVGIIQTWGVEIPTLIQVAPPSATFGNKNNAAQYLLFALSASYCLLLSATKPLDEGITALAAALITTYFLHTGTRAAWGAAIVALLVIWFVLRLRGFSPEELLSLGKRKWRILFGIVIFVTVMNTVPRYLVPNFGGAATLARLQSMLETEADPSALSRFAIWANALAMFRDYPVLGVGKGNFQFVYPLYNRRVIKDPSFTVEAKAAEAHNDYVQLLAEVGILGTAMFLWILILLARKYWQHVKEGFDAYVVSIGFALTAILLEAFWDFPFEHPTPSVLFWIYAGLLWALSHSQSSTNIPRPVEVGLITPLTLATTLAAILSFMHFRAEFYYSRASFGDYQVKTFVEKLQRAEEDFSQAIYLYPFDFRYHHWKAVLMLRKGNPKEALQANLQALAMNPYHINTLNNLGVIYTALGNIPKAIQAFETTLRIWPNYVNVRNNLGQLYERTGDREKAIEVFRGTLGIDPANKLASEKLAKLLSES